MKKFIGSIKTKTAYMFGLAAASLVGGLTAGIVMASIPDSNGVIHACRANTGGSVRIIDTASESCTGSVETEVTWDKEGIQAYAHILHNGTLDTDNSRNIVTAGPSQDSSAYCIEVSGSPENVMVSRENTGSSKALIRGVSEEDETIDEFCDSNHNVMIESTGSSTSGLFVTINQ